MRERLREIDFFLRLAGESEMLAKQAAAQGNKRLRKKHLMAVALLQLRARRAKEGYYIRK